MVKKKHKKWGKKLRKKKDEERDEKRGKIEKRLYVRIYVCVRKKKTGVTLKNTDESPVFKIPVRFRGFALPREEVGNREEWGWWGLKGLLERRWRTKRKRGEGVERSESTDCRGDK